MYYERSAHSCIYHIFISKYIKSYNLHPPQHQNLTSTSNRQLPHPSLACPNCPFCPCPQNSPLSTTSWDYPTTALQPKNAASGSFPTDAFGESAWPKHRSCVHRSARSAIGSTIRINIPARYARGRALTQAAKAEESHRRTRPCIQLDSSPATTRN